MSAKKEMDGISFNIVSRQKLDNLTLNDKLKFIIKEVQKGKILVLEQGLTPVEQASLIEHTMKEIKEDTFIGIEMEGYSEDKATFFQRLLGKMRKPRMSVIGPADLLKTVCKDNDMIQTIIVPGKRS